MKKRAPEASGAGPAESGAELERARTNLQETVQRWGGRSVP